MSGRIAATLPFPALASAFSLVMALKLFVKELAGRLFGPFADEAEADVTDPRESASAIAVATLPTLPNLMMRTRHHPPIQASRPIGSRTDPEQSKPLRDTDDPFVEESSHIFEERQSFL